MRSWPSKGLLAHIHAIESLESSLGNVNEEDLPQTKDLDDRVGGIENADHRVRRGDPLASSKA